MKTELSSLDIRFLLEELQEIVGGRIQKIHMAGRAVHISFHLKGKGTKLLVAGGGRLFLSSYKHRHDEKPSTFCMLLRKHLSNKRITAVKQKAFERIVFVRAGDVSLVLELFGSGNIILLDRDMRIIAALEVQKWKDRIVAMKEQYKFPPSSLDPSSLSLSLLSHVLSSSEKKLVAFLAREMSFGGQYAEELCHIAGIDKSRACNELSEDDITALSRAVDAILKRKKNPRVYFSGGRPFFVSPFPMEIFKRYDEQVFDSFNEAVDEYFSNLLARHAGAESGASPELERLKNRLKMQKEKLKVLEDAVSEAQEKAELIYSNYSVLEEVRVSLTELAEKHGWSALAEKIKKVPSLSSVESFDPKEKAAVVSLSGRKIKLRLGVSLEQNASNYYERAKRLKRKISGLKAAIEETERALAGARQRADVDKKGKGLEKVRKKAAPWYEKFRWFVSSGGFLCVAGKDATSNEILIKKHMQKDDIVFHAEISGSPFLLVRTEGRDVDMDTLKEAAQFVGVYSRAWRAGVGSVDTYYVKPEQVSKKAPSGEYISRGSFMIYGKKSFIRAELKLAFGFDGKKVIAGPVQTISKLTPRYVVICPGSTKSKALAQKIRQALMDKCSREEIEILRRINIDEIQRFIPAGKGDLVG